MLAVSFLCDTVLLAAQYKQTSGVSARFNDVQPLYLLFALCLNSRPKTPQQLLQSKQVQSMSWVVIGWAAPYAFRCRPMVEHRR